MTHWELPFLLPVDESQLDNGNDSVLVILNQPFSLPLFLRLWWSTKLHLCADGGANRLYDLLEKGASINGADLRITE